MKNTESDNDLDSRYPIFSYGSKFTLLPKLEGVYVFTDTISGNRLVGSTKNLYERAIPYFSSTAKKSNLIKKLDVSMCTFQVLETGKYEFVIDRLQRELYWIKKLNTIYPYGFNQINPVTEEFFEKKHYKRNLFKFKIGKRYSSSQKFDWGKASKINVLSIRDRD